VTTGLLIPVESDCLTEDFWGEDSEVGVAGLDAHPLEIVDSGPSQRRRGSDDEVLFSELACELASATAGFSSTRRAGRHPAFGEIIAMGDRAVPFLLDRLEVAEARPLWLRLLGVLTGFRPDAGEETVSAASEAWLDWGAARGLR
jgi:hypothetical protein